MTKIIMKDVSFLYKDGRNILNNVSIEILEGENVSILGPSGCGKTSLLGVISGINKPISGSVIYEGINERNDISMIFQENNLFDWFNVKDNIILPYKINKRRVDENRVEEILKMLKIEDIINKYPSQLSGGEKQRVAIARSLMNKSKFILMDEPFSAIDPLSKEVIRKEIKSILSSESVTTIMVTHDIEEAVLFGDKIIIFKDKSGNIEKIIEKKGKKDKILIDEIRKIIFG